MLEVIASTRSDMSPALFKALARYRYEVFVKGLGWALPCAEGLEVDAFDRPDTVYVLARDSKQANGLQFFQIRFDAGQGVGRARINKVLQTLPERTGNLRVGDRTETPRFPEQYFLPSR